MKFDSDRMTFLRALDEAVDVDVTEFEARFIENALKYQTASPAFSDRQREVIEKMFKTYGHRVKIPVSAYRVPQRPLPECPPDRCGWLVGRGEADGQKRCGAPVAEGKNFCAAHMQERAATIARWRKLKDRLRR